MTTNVVVIDTGAGNIPSVLNALRSVSDRVSLSSEINLINKADAVVLPGVGSFPTFMKNLDELNLTGAIIENIQKGKHMLGICVGMQVLSQASSEFEGTSGFGVINGIVKNLSELGIKNSRIPHVGWNGIRLDSSCGQNDPLMTLSERDVYFMHSYGFEAETVGAIGWTDYEIRFCSAVRIQNTLGVQFHPEKSHVAGLDFLASWLESTKR